MFAKIKNYRYLLLAVLVLGLSLTALAAPGDLDLTFDADGKVTTPFGVSSGDDGASVAVQTDGKIVVGGSSNNDFALARYNADGPLDVTFGTGGKVITPISTSAEDYILAIAIQADGKIVAAGYVNNGAAFDDIAVARYNTNGSLDTSFDTDGKLTTAIGAGDDFAFGVAISGVNIVVAGASNNGVGEDFAIVRYKPDGSLDGSFDGDGKLTLTIGGITDRAKGIAIQTDGKMIVIGESLIGANYRFAAARLNPNGSLDTSFGMSGIAITAIGTNDFADSVVIQPDGFIVVAGYSNLGGNFDFALVRYKPDGNLDPAFDGDGKVTTPIGTAFDIAFSVAIQSTGKIVAAGSSENGSFNRDFALVRYNSDGSLDTSFGAGGKVTTAFGTENDEALGMAIQPDDKIVLAGSTFTGTSDDFAVARYLGASIGFLYIISENTTNNLIYGYSVNETTGALVLLGGFPVATGSTGGSSQLAERIAIDRTNNRLFVINANSFTVSAYSINPTTGALTALPFSPISLGSGGWHTIAVHPTGSPLVIGDGGSTPSVKSYTITATTATEAAGSPYTISGTAAPYSSVFSQDGSFFYTGGNNGAFFEGFSVTAATGVLTPLAGTPFNSGNNFPAAYATDSQGRLFMGNGFAGQLRGFTSAGGVPGAVAGNPFTSALFEQTDGVLHPNEQFYFVADRTGNQVGAYQIGGTGGATTLTPVAGSPFASGGNASNAIAINQAGKFLFAANSLSRNLTTYVINSTTGVLLNIGVQPSNTLGTTGFLSGIAYYFPTFAPTAASVSVSGRVSDANGNGISRARVILTDSNGETRYAFTSSFGYFRFDEVEVGETYIFEIRHKRYQFAPQVLTIHEAVEDLNFVADSSAFRED